MTNRTAYLEQVAPILMNELTTVINSTGQYKPTIKPSHLTSVWSLPSPDDGLRTRIQYLARRKRGAWAFASKTAFEELFLPNLNELVSKEWSRYVMMV